jgi:hypothetical protein
VRTLVVSDLHLGAAAERDVLRRGDALAALVSELERVDRLVLLGDVVELRHGPARDALAAASPVLRALGAALGADREVVVVAGNHDHQLVEPWRERAARHGAPPPLGLEAAVDWRAGEALATIARRLAPARVRAAYPGVWLRDDVYATHGHYCDRHTTIPMLERIGAGAMARIVREPASGPGDAEAYERTLAPIYAWIHAVAQAGGPDVGPSSHGASARAWGAMAGSTAASGRGAGLRRRAAVAGFPFLIAALNRLGLGPLRAEISSTGLRRAGLLAFAEVLDRLGVDSRYAIFGHTHRAGPIPRDQLFDWITPAGTSILNTGSWVHEPAFVGRDPSASPYRPGFAVALGAEGPPELVNLLD